MSEPITMYTTVWCGYCIRLKWQLDREQIPYREIDIAHDEDAVALVERVNGGNRTVPTVVLPDGTALCNPSVADIRAGMGSSSSAA